MKQAHISQVEQSFYVAQPHLERKDWPYRAQTAPARLGGTQDIAPAPFDTDQCPECGGRLWIERAKNPRTGSRRLSLCGNKRHAKGRQ